MTSLFILQQHSPTAAFLLLLSPPSTLYPSPPILSHPTGPTPPFQVEVVQPSHHTPSFHDPPSTPPSYHTPRGVASHPVLSHLVPSHPFHPIECISSFPISPFQVEVVEGSTVVDMVQMTTAEAGEEEDEFIDSGITQMTGNVLSYLER